VTAAFVVFGGYDGSGSRARENYFPGMPLARCRFLATVTAMKLRALASLSLALTLGACTRDDSAVKEKLDSIDQRLAAIETAIKSGAGARGNAGGAERPSRPRPNPTDVYAVDVAGSPTEGNDAAKVTIVEGFEFACPYCRKVGPTIDQLKKDYGDDPGS
jgi:protein-disulfide isomerase